jgi:AcrR family transcriptional regulator
MKKFDQKCEEIKKAGIKSFSKYGYSKTTMEDIAKMLGMKKNSLYYYFENKEALFREIVEDTIAIHVDLTHKIAEDTLPARDKLLSVIKCFIKYIQERTLEYAISVSSFIEIGKVIRKTFPDLEGNQRSVFKKILEEGIASKEFKPIDTGLLSRDLAELIPAIFTHNYNYSDAEFVSEVDFDALTEEINRIISYIIDGIALKN